MEQPDPNKKIKLLFSLLNMQSSVFQFIDQFFQHQKWRIFANSNFITQLN